MHSLITTHSFISLHLQHSLSNPTPPSLLFILYSIYTSKEFWHCVLWSYGAPFSFNRFVKLEPPYQIPHHHSVRFVQSLHGLLCLIEQSAGFDIDHAIILWNPSISRYVRLEIPVIKHDLLGFGFDSKNNDFKVIRSFSPDGVELYSLNEGAGKVLDVSFSQELELGGSKFSDTCCFLNGNVHWIVYKARIFHNKNILMFNVGEEKIKNMDFPPELVKAHFSNLYVTVTEGCLSVLRYLDWDDDKCEIWMMKEYCVTESWTKIATIKFPRGVSQFFGRSASAKVLLLRQNAAGRRDGDFISLDSLDQSEEITDLGIHGFKISAWDYTQSLVLLDREKTCERDAS